MKTWLVSGNVYVPASAGYVTSGPLRKKLSVDPELIVRAGCYHDAARAYRVDICRIFGDGVRVVNIVMTDVTGKNDRSIK